MRGPDIQRQQQVRGITCELRYRIGTRRLFRAAMTAHDAGNDAIEPGQPFPDGFTIEAGVVDELRGHLKS